MIARLLLTLLILPVAGLARTWDLRSYTGTMLAVLTGRERAYSQRYTERFLARLAHAGAAQHLTEVIAKWTWELGYEAEGSFEQVGQWQPWRYNRSGQVICEVAAARFALKRPDDALPPLEVEVALIRDWRKLLVVEQADEVRRENVRFLVFFISAGLFFRRTHQAIARCCHYRRPLTSS